MIRRDHIEQAQGAVFPSPEKAIIAQTDAFLHLSFYPNGEAETAEGIPGYLTILDQSTGERDFHEASMPRSRLMESKDFIVNYARDEHHRRGEVVAAVSLGAIVTGTLVVRHLRKRA